MDGNNPINKMTAQFISRFDWDAKSPRKVETMELPVTRFVSTWANVDPCSTKEECKQRVKELQNRHMEDKQTTDIKHHFMVGGDGFIYEGRGWHNKGPKYPYNLPFADELSGNSIEIGFLGRPGGGKPDDVMMKSVSDCVAFGLHAKFLQEKLLFFWRTQGHIEYLSFYETNAPGESDSKNFTNHDISKYEATRKHDNSPPQHVNAGMKSSTTTDSSKEKKDDQKT